MGDIIKKRQILRAVAVLGVAVLGLVACKAKPPTAPNATNHSPTYTITAVNVPSGFVTQLALDGDKGLLIVNSKGELWRLADNRLLAKDVSVQITPVAGFGKIALANGLGKFMLLQVQGDAVTTWSSDIHLSPVAGMVMLPHATIAVQDERGGGTPCAN